MNIVCSKIKHNCGTENYKYKGILPQIKQIFNTAERAKSLVYHVFFEVHFTM